MMFLGNEFSGDGMVVGMMWRREYSSSGDLGAAGGASEEGNRSYCASGVLLWN